MLCCWLSTKMLGKEVQVTGFVLLKSSSVISYFLYFGVEHRLSLQDISLLHYESIVLSIFVLFKFFEDFLLFLTKLAFMEYLIKLSEEAWNKYLPHISIDSVVFGFHEGEIKVLLLKMKGVDKWLLPGGYLLKEEGLDDAAYRILKERSGAEKIFLHQFGVMGAPQRSQEFFKDMDDDLWHKQRFITIGYYALVDNTEINVIVDELSDQCEWKALKALPELAMDHYDIIQRAMEALRLDLNHKPIGYNLLPPEFTMPELQRLYETILNKTLNRGNFYRKMMSFDILEKLDETRKGAANKSPNLYRFNMEKYQMSLNTGLQLSW